MDKLYGEEAAHSQHPRNACLVSAHRAYLKTDSLRGRPTLPAGRPWDLAQYGLVMETVRAVGFFVILINLRGQEVTKVKPQTVLKLVRREFGKRQG